MQQYLLNIQQPVGDPPPPEVLEPIMRELTALNDEMRAAGAWVFAGGLHDPDASSVVRVKDGEVVVTDGPYVEGKEHVGGFTVLRAADLDEALKWAGRLARVLGLPIEVRPFHDRA
ncbi:YciI family protein [Amycolatopsis magusensis]|uniref:YciI family protein n=1 Tax=Amycolatopsis magusensis TaxID=882444 RepID=UPI0037A5E7E0